MEVSAISSLLFIGFWNECFLYDNDFKSTPILFLNVPYTCSLRWLIAFQTGLEDKRSNYVSNLASKILQNSVINDKLDNTSNHYYKETLYNG